jgi:hypothetical protein
MIRKDGWALVADPRVGSRWPDRPDRPVVTVVASVKQAIVLLAAGHIAGILLQDFDQLAGLIELTVPPPARPGHPEHRRPRLLHPAPPE